MDENTTILKAIAAGALLNMQPNLMGGPRTMEPVQGAYLELKRMIEEKYERVDVDLLDSGPASAERQAQMAQQLADAGVGADQAVLAQAQKTLELIGDAESSLLWAVEPSEPPAHLK